MQSFKLYRFQKKIAFTAYGLHRDHRPAWKFKFIKYRILTIKDTDYTHFTLFKSHFLPRRKNGLP